MNRNVDQRHLGLYQHVSQVFLIRQENIIAVTQLGRVHAKGPRVILKRLQQHKLIRAPRVKDALLIVTKLDDRLLIDRIVDQRHNQVVDVALLL